MKLVTAAAVLGLAGLLASAAGAQAPQGQATQIPPTRPAGPVAGPVAGPPASGPVQRPIQGPALGTPAPAPVSNCSLMTRSGDQYVGTALPGFDPSVKSVPLPVVQANSNAAMVLCNRTTVMPEVTDYRILTEMHLPLAISAGNKTVFVGAANGKLQVGVPEGQLSAQETTAIQDRIDEMQAAMQGPTPARPSAPSPAQPPAQAPAKPK